eukprot:gene41495-51396_t
MSTNYTVSITFEVVTDESADAGEVAYRGYEREREDMDFDELKRLVQDFGFSEPAGSWLHIEGGNGCGKTSLLRI